MNLQKRPMLTPLRSWLTLLLLHLSLTTRRSPLPSLPPLVRQMGKGREFELIWNRSFGVKPTCESGFEDAWRSYFVNRPWRPSCAERTTVPGRSPAGSPLSNARPKGILRSQLCRLRVPSWSCLRAPCLNTTPTSFCSYWPTRSPATIMLGYTLHRWDALQTPASREWLSTSNCYWCVSSPPSFSWSRLGNSSTKRWALPQVAITGTASCFCGRCYLLKSNLGSNSGTTAFPLALKTWMPRQGPPTQLKTGWCRNIPAEPTAPTTRQQRMIEAMHGASFCHQMGRSGPKAGDSAGGESSQGFLHACPDPLLRLWTHTSQIIPSTVDMRVGGSFGRNPPEAEPSTSLDIFTRAKRHDPSTPAATLNRLGARGPALVNAVLHVCIFYIYRITLPRQKLMLVRLLVALIGSLPTAQSRQLVDKTQPLQALAIAIFLTMVAQSCLWVCARLTLRRTRFTPTRVVPGCIRRRQGGPCNKPVRAPVQQRGESRGEPRKRPSPASPPYLGPRHLLKLLLLAGLPVFAQAFPGPNVRHPADPCARPPGLTRAFGHMAQQLSSSRKRSFKRAQARALRDGETYYRGRLHTLQGLSLRYVGPATPQPSKQAPKVNGLRFVTWNCGGLNASRYAETLAWLEMEREAGRPVHILCVQESKWSTDSEYATDRWYVVHSSTGKAMGGVLFFVCRSLVDSSQMKHAALVPGRLLHLRLDITPPLDLLGVYQHAWSNAPKLASTDHQRELASQKLLQDRHTVWTHIGSWVHSVPTRHQLLILGDMNCTLRPHSPNVGMGIALHKSTVHPDQQTFQSLAVSLGLNALNSWGREGRKAATYLHLQHSSVQIDFALARLPCQPGSLRARPLHEAPIVHPTGLRHVPVSGHLCLPVAQRRTYSIPPHVSPKRVQEQLQARPELARDFQHALTDSLQPGTDLETGIMQAWRRCTQRLPRKATSVSTGNQLENHISLKSYWDSKRALRTALARSEQYHAPAIWHIADAPARLVRNLFASSAKGLSSLLSCWKAACKFRSQDRYLRQRVRQRKHDKVDQLIAQAQAVAQAGLSGLYQLANQIRPKTSRRSIHFRGQSGQLLTAEEELHSLKYYFMDLYRSEMKSTTVWRLTEHMNITAAEVANAFRQLSARKALPRGQAPAALWKAAAPVLEHKVCEAFNEVLKPGPLQFPDSWNKAFLTLVPKPGKPPTKAENLRPISLLPALPKLLARIAAERLKPYLLSALASTPQFAYVARRRVEDALDRVTSHCRSVRERLKGGGRSIFKLKEGHRESLLYGGMQLSLDLSKAYDRLPRASLLKSLERIQAPAELISLIMYIHDNALLVISKNDREAELSMGQGIRQGCGLSPLLWIGFTLLIFDRLQEVLPADALTGYADDFHAQWQFEHPRDFRNACANIPVILHTLRDLGMQIALDKTVILLAIKGRAAPQLLQDFTSKVKGQRCLSLSHPVGDVHIPIKTSHSYLGIKISYHSFEQATMTHRLAQAWIAFRRLHVFLKHRQVPLRKRLLLWQTTVWTIAQYGLTSVGVDHVSASQLLSQVHRQLRMVARSPAHISHESNESLLARLQLTGPLQVLHAATSKRVQQSKLDVGHLQPPRVHQWWDLVLLSFQLQPAADTQTRLTEVTQILRIRSSCPVCGQEFPSNHAVNVHLGKKHPEYRKPREANTTRKNRRDDSAMEHALQGLPTCKHCRKSFCAWPQFFGHFSQEACPILHAQDKSSKPQTAQDLPSSPPAQGASAPGGTDQEDSDPVPLFHRQSLQELARPEQLLTLAKTIRALGSLNHCPECNQWCSSPAYVTRHAVKVHSQVRQHQQQVLDWLKARGHLRRPCEFCDSWYKVRPQSHLVNCPVLWTCGHLLARFSSLTDPGQVSLHGFFSRRGPACRSNGGAGYVREDDEAVRVPGGPSVHRTAHAVPDFLGNGPGSGEEGSGGPHHSNADTTQVCQGRDEGRPTNDSPSSPPALTGHPSPASRQPGRRPRKGQVRPGSGSRDRTAGSRTQHTQGLEQPQPQPCLENRGMAGPLPVASSPQQPGPGAEPRARGQDQGVACASYPPHPTARGSDDGGEPGQRVHLILPDPLQPQPLVDHRQPLRSGTGLAGQEGSQSAEPNATTAECDVVLCPEQHVADDDPLGGCGAGGYHPAGEGAQSGPGHRLCVSYLERGNQDSRAGTGGPSGAHGSGQHDPDDADLHGVSRCGRALPPRTPAHGEPQLGGDSFCLGSAEPLTRKPGDVPHDAPLLSQCSHPPGGDDAPADEARPLSAGPASGPPGSELVSLEPSSVLALN